MAGHAAVERENVTMNEPSQPGAPTEQPLGYAAAGVGTSGRNTRRILLGGFKGFERKRQVSEEEQDGQEENGKTFKHQRWF